MNADPPVLNNRVLVIDDMAELHGVFRKLLGQKPETDDMEDLESTLFGPSVAQPAELGFELDFALQGEEGLARVRSALAEHRPYSMAFVDMRMPPGWDGLQTIEAIWREDRDVEIVICTAYSEYSDRDIVARLGPSDQVLFLRKPFDAIEVRLLARALTEKWTRRRHMQLRLTELEGNVVTLSRELVAAKARLLEDTAVRFAPPEDQPVVRTADDAR
jgi:two-component system NtrC family sensor kinase